MNDGAQRDPPSPQKPITGGREDTPPPDPPGELPREDVGERTFEHDGRRWIARLSGKGASGTGAYGLALVEAVHFADAEEPAVPLFEALLGRSRFEHLFDGELIRLLEGATPITPGAGRP
ncbi:hypothetical protein BH23GEM9_BH23GEM9_21150 [soil metagenome]